VITNGGASPTLRGRRGRTYIPYSMRKKYSKIRIATARVVDPRLVREPRIGPDGGDSRVPRSSRNVIAERDADCQEPSDGSEEHDVPVSKTG